MTSNGNFNIDKRSFCFGALSFGSVSLLLAGPASAQTAAPAATSPPSVSPQYIVTYFEVAPAAAAAAAKLARAYRADTHKETGAAPLGVFQGAYLPYHFAMVGQWIDTKAFAVHSEGAAMTGFRRALTPHLIAPYDERRHHALDVGQALASRSGLVTITHVDIIPTYREAGIESVKMIASQSRGERGCVRFDALTQSARPNHMTLVQAWHDDAAYRRYIVSPLSKAFRESLTPRSGSLYDERYYRPIA
jgi:quinol monooxygenase YgiN